MFYRVRADLAFIDPDEANDFYHDCEVALPKAASINPGQNTEEIGYIALEQCYHDEDPTEPCEILKSEHIT